MADMKLNEAKLMESVERSIRHATEIIQERAKIAIGEVGEVSRALRDTPDNVAELFRTAVVAQVKEVSFVNAQQRIWVQVNTGGLSFAMSGSDRAEIPAGKYRAMFFLLKIEE